MLKITDLNHSYGETIISYPDWQVAQGEHSLILGNSGSGKTTLLHLIGGLMTPLNGMLEIDGKNIGQLSKAKLDRFRGEHIGIVFQKSHLVRSLTVKENIMLSQWLGQRKTNARQCDEIMEKLAIADLKLRKVHEISQGQAQRVSIARALVNHPKLLLADEPTASLDDENCARVIGLLKTQASENSSTLIVATHDQRVKDEFKNQLSL